MRTTLRRVALAIVVFQPCLVGVARSQSIERTSPGRVSVRAKNEPLGDLLRELQTVFDIEKLIIEPGVEQRPVTLTLTDEPVDEAIMEILDTAKVSGVVWGGKGEPFRVFAGSGDNSKVPEPNQPPVTDPPGAARREPPRDEGVNPAPSRGRKPPRPPAGGGRDSVRPRIATGDAALVVPATGTRLAGVAAILGLGFLLGQLIVVRTNNAAR